MCGSTHVMAICMNFSKRNADQQSLDSTCKLRAASFYRNFLGKNAKQVSLLARYAHSHVLHAKLLCVLPDEKSMKRQTARRLYRPKSYCFSPRVFTVASLSTRGIIRCMSRTSCLGIFESICSFQM